TILCKVVAFNLGKRARAGDARCARIPEFVAITGIHRNRFDCRLPLSIGRTRWLSIAGNIAAIHYLERFHCAAYIRGSSRFDGVTSHNIRYDNFRAGDLWTYFRLQWLQVSDVKLIPGIVFYVQRLVIRMAKTKRDRIPMTDPAEQRKRKESRGI